MGSDHNSDQNVIGLADNKKTENQYQGSDSPLADSDRDEFDFDDYSALLAQRLVEEEPPFTLGIFGRWGSGKTSLMRRIGHELAVHYADQGYKQDAVLPIWFNAWKYDREDAIWRALLVHTLEALQNYLVDDLQQNGKLIQQPRFETYTDHDETLKKLRAIKASLYRTVEQKQKGQVEVDLKKLGIGAVKLGLPMLTGGLLSGGFLEQLFKSKDGENVSAVTQMLDAFHRAEQSQYFEKIQFLNDFHERFEEVIGGLVDSEQLPLQKVVFFIDDLDRCLPDKAIQVFEAIKLFLDNQYCVFVVGVDEQAIQAGIECRYQNFFSHYREPDRESAGKDKTADQSSSAQELHLRRLFKDEYLEKIIQLPFHLPDITRSRLEPFIAKRLRLSDIDNQEKPSSSIALLPRLLAVGVEPNPRKIKRLCYSINLIWGIVCRRKLHMTLHPEVIAKLLLIQQRDPVLYRAVQSDPLLLRFLESYWKAEEDIAQRKADQSVSDAGMKEIEITSSTPAKNPYESYAESARQFRWVKDLLQWQATEKDLHIVTFAELGRTITNYLSLTAAAKTESAEAVIEQVVTRLDEKVLKDLLNEDITIIEKAVSNIGDEVRGDYQRYLLTILNKIEHPWRERVSAGDALGFLGDPRFAKSCWENEEYWRTIKEGKFFRGCLQGEKGVDSEEIDGNKYMLPEFQLARFPVTNADYQLFVKATGQPIPNHWSGGQYPSGLENHPVVYVSWNDAQAYIHWLNSQNDGYRYSLPTESQWERAARGVAIISGQENRRRYPWGDEFDAHKCNVKETGLGRTSTVGCFPDGASPEGLLDMVGNVWEWCTDWFDKNYYQQGKVEENRKKGDYKAVRGGAFDDIAWNASCTIRNLGRTGLDDYKIGFRVARIPHP